MPRRPTSPPSTRNRLRERLDDAAAPDSDDIITDEIPLFAVLNASAETCVDAERRLHRIGGDTYQLREPTHESAMREEGS